jgi:aryl-alcohol dehydrogenase-like predicted oxidoreductase
MEIEVNFLSKRILGRTGLAAGRLGISSSWSAPADAYEEAFEKGCNYFTWGTFIKGRSAEMLRALKNIVAKGHRDNLILSMLTYAHDNFLTRHYLRKGLNLLGTDFTDVLLLGYFSKRPPQRLIDGAVKLKEEGLVKYLGVTSHNRNLIPELAKEGIFDIFHFRYNAAHRGAEKDIFPLIPAENRPGMVSFTATRWKQLLNPKKMPPGEEALTAADCYRFVLSNPDVDICMMGARDRQQMTENLTALDRGPLTHEEMERIRKIGDYLYKN